MIIYGAFAWEDVQDGSGCQRAVIDVTAARQNEFELQQLEL